ncbi:MAG TPA: DUF1801 domain-containing protein, partial [Anaerolineales bacterium]|nr:DUF1801 domain-containing protein [Anaerolineales bacterium]
MRKSNVQEYLQTLTADRRAIIRTLRNEVKNNLPPGYVETFDGRRFSYEIPLTSYPNTYNGRPLCLAALASQQSYVTLYLMAVYGDQELAQWFRELYSGSGKTLRMGKSCVHFRKLEDIA